MCVLSFASSLCYFNDRHSLHHLNYSIPFPRFRIKRAAANAAAAKDGTSATKKIDEAPLREDAWKGRARGGPGAATVTNAQVLKQMLYGPYRESLVPGGLGSLSWAEVTTALNKTSLDARGGSRKDEQLLLATQVGWITSLHVYS
jgi:hypothetical protein